MSRMNDIILALVARYGGDWKAVRAAISEKDTYDPDWLPTPESMAGWEALCVTAPDYPAALLRKNCPQIPFALFAKGDPSKMPGKDALMLIPNPRERIGDRPAVDALIASLPRAGIPAVILWREAGDGAGHARAALDAYKGSGVPFAVVLPKSAKGRSKIADEAAAGGGVALTEALPWEGDSARSMDPTAGRIAASLADKGALVLGGLVRSATVVDAAYALNAGLDVGCVAREIGDPEGGACVSLIREGAAIVGSADDAEELAYGEARR